MFFSSLYSKTPLKKLSVFTPSSFLLTIGSLNHSHQAFVLITLLKQSLLTFKYNSFSRLLWPQSHWFSLLIHFLIYSSSTRLLVLECLWPSLMSTSSEFDSIIWSTLWWWLYNSSQALTFFPKLSSGLDQSSTWNHDFNIAKPRIHFHPHQNHHVFLVSAVGTQLLRPKNQEVIHYSLPN